MRHVCPYPTTPNPAALPVDQLVKGRQYRYIYCRPTMRQRKGKRTIYGREVVHLVVTFLWANEEGVRVRWDGGESFLLMCWIGLEPYKDGTFGCNHLAPVW